jgi:hypothetical protein
LLVKMPKLGKGDAMMDAGTSVAPRCGARKSGLS